MDWIVPVLALVGVLCILGGSLAIWLYKTFDPLKDFGFEDPLDGQDLFDKIPGDHN